MAFLDLLGYRKVLERLDVFPLPSQHAGQIALVAALERAVRIRKRFSDAMKMFMENPNERPIQGADHLTSDAREFVERMRSTVLMHMSGPDNVILGCPLAMTPTHYPPRAVHQLISAAAYAQVLQLGVPEPEDALPLRGGLELGAGALLGSSDDQMLYSPALTHAYEIETERATVPRIVVGHRLLEYLNQLSIVPMEQDSPHSRLQLSIGRELQAIVISDEDGEAFLDFFGEGIRRYLPAELAYSLASRAWSFVQAERDKHDHPSVRSKYEWLVRYIEPRLELWGVTR